MLTTCRYCGRIHDRKMICPKKPKRKKKNTDAETFRKTTAWQRKAEEIKERDMYLCQLCLRGFRGSLVKYNYHKLSVHHVVPILEDWDLRLENENLITTCEPHHKMMERGEISRDEIRAIIKEQEQGDTPGIQ